MGYHVINWAVSGVRTWNFWHRDHVPHSAIIAIDADDCVVLCVGFAQVVVLFALMSSLCTVPGPTGLQLPLMLLTILTGTALGLLISASTSSAAR